MAELKSQIYELKKNQIDADSIYGFLGAFNEVYSECTDAEKKQFMQAFIERIDIFPERRKDGNWIQDIKFQFPVPIIKEGKEVAQIKGISLDKEKSDEHMVSLEKLSTLESCVLLCRADTQKSLILRSFSTILYLHQMKKMCYTLYFNLFIEYKGKNYELETKIAEFKR